MNSSGFVGGNACSFNQANVVYLASGTTDLAIGTYAEKDVHFVVNNSVTDAMTIRANNKVYIGGVNATGDKSVTNDTSTNASYYPAMYSVTSGVPSVSYTSNSKLYFNPSTGTLNSTIYNSLSDKKKKKNVKKIKNAVETVNQLNGVEFQWKESGAKSYGVIAQELEQIIPDLVSTDNNGNKSVNYNGLFGFLINAIKEQQKQIDDLKKNK
jgi:hypothetical protein